MSFLRFWHEMSISWPIILSFENKLKIFYYIMNIQYIPVILTPITGISEHYLWCRSDFCKVPPKTRGNNQNIQGVIFQRAVEFYRATFFLWRQVG